MRYLPIILIIFSNSAIAQSFVVQEYNSSYALHYMTQQSYVWVALTKGEIWPPLKLSDDFKLSKEELEKLSGEFKKGYPSYFSEKEYYIPTDEYKNLKKDLSATFIRSTYCRFNEKKEIVTLVQVTVFFEPSEKGEDNSDV